MNKNKFIIMSFPRFAGGKFISNCLSLSKHCCPQDPTMAKFLTKHPDDYSYRLSGILKTLPPTKSAMIDWINQYEFGDNQLYGHETVRKWQDGITCIPNTLVNEILDSGMSMFLTAHGGDTCVRNLLKVWPDSVVIKLISHTKFSKISQKLKSTDTNGVDEYAGNYSKSRYELLSGPSWPSWHEFEEVGYDINQLPKYQHVADEISTFYNWKGINEKSILFNVDKSIFEKTRFLGEMKLLYEKLSLHDYNSELISEFWQSYMTLHVDTING